MKTSKLIILATILCFAGGKIQAQENVRIANGEWPPFTSESLKYGGLVSRIVTEAFGSQGVRVEYGWFPWKRSLWLAETGKWDGSAPWVRTVDRAEKFYYSNSVIEGTDVFFHLKKYTFDWKSYEDLKNVKIGAANGYFYGEAFQDAEKKGKIYVHRSLDDKQNFKLLLKGRLDILVINREVGYEILGANFSPQEKDLFTYHSKPVRIAPHYLLLSKKLEKGEALTTLFNKGMKQLRETKKFDQYILESREGLYRLK